MQKYTYGKTPAAIYLYDYLIKNNLNITMKRVGKALTTNRNMFLQLEKANVSGILSSHNLARILNSMRLNFHVDVGDELVSNLTTNVLIGEMKSLIRRASSVRKIELLQGKIKKDDNKDIVNKNGDVIVNYIDGKKVLPKYDISLVKDEINSDSLYNKWTKKHGLKNWDND